MSGVVLLLSAFVLGALHALEPGHGKTVVAAYLVGTKGRVRDAVALGGIVTLTHTFSIILLGLLTSVAAAYLVPETVHEVLEVFSGLLIVGVGLWMVNDRIIRPRARWGRRHAGEDGHVEDRHAEPGHTHEHHAHAASLGSGWQSWQGMAHHQRDHHEHGHDRHRQLNDHRHHHHHPRRDRGEFGHAHEHESGHHEGEAHEHAELALVGASLRHEHGEVTHAHSIPAGETHHHHPELEHPEREPGPAEGRSLGEKASLGTLITLGISGGIVPCPAALALLLAAAAAGDVLGGVSLVVVFSLGLAAVLIAIGIGMVKAASFAGRYLSGGLIDRISQRAGAVGAVVVTALGLAMTARAIVDVAGVPLL